MRIGERQEQGGERAGKGGAGTERGAPKKDCKVLCLVDRSLGAGAALGTDGALLQKAVSLPEEPSFACEVEDKVELVGEILCNGDSTLRIVDFEAADTASAFSKEPGIIRVRAPGLINLLVGASQVCLNFGSGGHPLSAEYAVRP